MCSYVKWKWPKHNYLLSDRRSDSSTFYFSISWHINVITKSMEFIFPFSFLTLLLYIVFLLRLSLSWFLTIYIYIYFFFLNQLILLYLWDQLFKVMPLYWVALFYIVFVTVLSWSLLPFLVSSLHSVERCSFPRHLIRYTCSRAH